MGLYDDIPVKGATPSSPTLNRKTIYDDVPVQKPSFSTPAPAPIVANSTPSVLPRRSTPVPVATPEPAIMPPVARTPIVPKKLSVTTPNLNERLFNRTSTPMTTSGPGTVDIAKKTAQYLLDPSTETKMRPIGFTQEEAEALPAIKGPRLTIGTAKIINEVGRTFVEGAVAAPNAIRGAFEDISASLAGRTPQKTKTFAGIPSERISLYDGQEQKGNMIETPGMRTIKRLEALDTERPDSPTLNLFQAFAEVPLNDILSVAVAGDIAKLSTAQILKYTKSSPALGVRASSIANLSPKEAADVISNRFKEEIQRVITDEAVGGKLSQAGINKIKALVAETRQIGTAYGKGELPNLNAFGKFLDDMSIKLNEDVKLLGKRSFLPVAEKTAAAPKTAIPGYRSGPAPKLKFGMSTEAVEPVGFGAKKVSLTPKEAKEFVKNSTLKQTFYHGADADTAARIRTHGFKPSADFPGNNSVSLATNADDAAHYATVNGKAGEVIPVQVNANKVKTFASTKEYLAALEATGGKSGAAQEAAIFKNYDAVIVKNGLGEGRAMVMIPDVSRLAIVGTAADEVAQPVGKAAAISAAVKATAKEVYKDTGDLSLKTLKKLEGRATVSKQFISDLTNSPDLKQVERDVIREALQTEGETINVSEFAEKVKRELLPLERSSSTGSDGPFNTQYENITLPDELRGPVANYSEHVYNSPIKTSAGDIHFRNDAGLADNYFGHTRVEDLPDKVEHKDMGYGLKVQQPLKSGGTRRVIEVQSDLYQKGNLENEMRDKTYQWEGETYAVDFNNKGDLSSLMKKTPNGQYISVDNLPKELHKKILEENTQRQSEMAKLRQYNDPTAHFRMVREEVKKAAEDGKTKLQFPTGETAMKIEGLGVENRWDDVLTESDLTLDNLKVGKEITERDQYDDPSSRWIITEVLGDGKFKAAPKSAYDNFGDLKDHDLIESFDISGKIDTNNPIYKFYEKDLGRYLTSKYGAKTTTDAQGVKWYEIDIKPDMANIPVDAFGVTGGIERDEDGNIRFDPVKAAIGVGLMGRLRKVGGADDFAKKNISPKIPNEVAGLPKAQRDSIIAKMVATKTSTPAVIEKAIKAKYAASGASSEPGFTKADEELAKIFTDMDLSLPGKRVFIESPGSGGTEVKGIASTFPQWIPEHLRSKKLFNKVMGNLDLEKLKYPDGNRSKQRELYDAILSELDSRLGIDTTAEREQIKKLYEQAETPAVSNRRTPGSGGPGNLAARALDRKVANLEQAVIADFNKLPQEKQTTLLAILPDDLKARVTGGKLLDVPPVTPERLKELENAIDIISKNSVDTANTPTLKTSRENIRLAYTPREQAIIDKEKPFDLDAAYDEYKATKNRTIINLTKAVDKDDRLNTIKATLEETQSRLVNERNYQAEFKKRVEEAQKFIPKHRSIGSKVVQSFSPAKFVDPETQKMFKDWRARQLIARELADEEIKRYNFPNAQGMEIIHKFQRGQKTEFTDTIAKAFDDLFDEANRRGLDVKRRENYIPQVYKESSEKIQEAIMRYMKDQGVDEQTAREYLEGVLDLPPELARRLKLNPTFIKTRTFPSYAVAMEYGLTPKYTNPAQLVAYYRQEMEKTLANKRFLDGLLEKGKLVPEQVAPKNYLPIAYGGPFKGYYSTPELKKLIEGIFRDENDIGTLDTFFRGAAKTSRFLQQVALSAGIPKTTINFFAVGQLIKNITAVKFNTVSPFIRANFKERSIRYLQDNANYLKMMSEEGIDVGEQMKGYAKIYPNITKSLKNRRAKLRGLPLKEKAKTAGGFLKEIVGEGWDRWFNERTFASFMPQMHLQTFKGIYLKAIEKGVPEAEARKLAAETTKNFYGLMEDWGRGVGTEEKLSTVFFAPKFREGIIRTLFNTGYSGYEIVKNLGGFRKPLTPGLKLNRHLLAGMALTYGLYNVLNHKINDEYMWDNEPGREFSLKIPRDNGEIIYVDMMPSFLAFPRAIGTGALALAKGDTSTAIQKFGTLFSMPVKYISEIISNQDYFGREIYKEYDSIPVKAAKSAAHVGLSANHPYIKEAGKYLSGTVPLHQAITAAMEIPIKYSTQEKAQKSEFYRTLDKMEVERARATDKIRPIYEQVQALKGEGRIDEAKAIVESLSDEEWAIYKNIQAVDKRRATNQKQTELYPLFEKVQELKAENKIEEAKAIVDNLNDDEWKTYQQLKKKFDQEKLEKAKAQADLTIGTAVPEKSLIKTIATYAHAVGVEPVTAFHRILTGQKIRRVDNGTVIVERLDMKDSQAIKEARGGNTIDLKLDHTIPLQLGGSNSESNLKLVTTEEWETYTPIENHLGRLLREGKISKKEAQQKIRDFKAGKLTAEEILK